jgi:hypothetical protein
MKYLKQKYYQEQAGKYFIFIRKFECNITKYFPGFLERKDRSIMHRKPPRELAFVLMFNFIGVYGV